MSDRYDPGAIRFHWLTAVLIVIVGVLGLLHDSWPKGTQSFWINIHALTGTLVWVLLMARFWRRRTHRPPPLPRRGACAHAAGGTAAAASNQ